MTISEQFPKAFVSDATSFAFVADCQINGQGQRDNTWSSPPGNCYTNFLFKMDTSMVMFSAQLAALSVAEVYESYRDDKLQFPVTLKWVNDVFIDGLKICGVLPKAEFQGKNSYFWIGIGANINLAPILGSTCLKDQVGSTSDLEVMPFIETLSRKLFANKKILEQGGFVSLKPKINQRLEFLDQHVKIFDFTLKEVLHQGKFVGIDDYGHALLEADGITKSVADGRMRIE